LAQAGPFTVESEPGTQVFSPIRNNDTSQYPQFFPCTAFREQRAYPPLKAEAVIEKNGWNRPEFRQKTENRVTMALFTESIRKLMGWYPTKNSFGHTSQNRKNLFFQAF